MGSSPHTRGARRGSSIAAAGLRIIPAYAGSTTCQSFPFHRMADHPRIRGEHAATKDPGSRVAGSSPHTRGARTTSRTHPMALRIIPAYAGSTRRRPGRGPASPDHPRIRGEHKDPGSRVAFFEGSSPHTRGALCVRGCLFPGRRIIPAYAGSTWLLRCCCPGRADHPRIRGEHPLPPFRGAGIVGSSPHTRGAPTPMRWDSCSRGIIPAYAGSTTSPCRGRICRGDHPRIRGEHTYMPEAGFPVAGSSPHTRGAPVVHRQ